MTSKRNSALDVLKCVAAFFVVTIHYNHVSGFYGDIYTRMVFAIVETAVPIFFIITGFYLPVLIERNRVQSHIVKILRMALASSIFYFFVYLCDASIRGNAKEWLSSHYTLGSLCMWLTGQDDPAAYHLWYFYCLLWTLALCGFVVHRWGYKILYAISLLAITYSFSGIGSFACYTTSIPCIAVGCILNQLNKKHSLCAGWIIIVCLVSAGGLLAEAYFQIELFAHNLLRISCAAALVSFGVMNPHAGTGSTTAKIGLKYSAYVYIFHVYVNYLLNFIITYNTTLLQVLRPWIVFVITLVLVVLFCRIKKRIILHAS